MTASPGPEPGQEALGGPGAARGRARAAVDARLAGVAGFAEARRLLSPVERAEWVLGEALAHLAGGAWHRWDQGLREVGGDLALARLAEAGAAPHPEAARLLRWCADHAPVGLVSVLPEVASVRWDALLALADDVVARWPADADPFAPGPVGSASRRALAPPGDPVAYPRPVAPDRPAEVLHALWEAGAPDDVLDEAAASLRFTRADYPGWVARWVGLAEPADALRARLFPVDPLAARLGLEELPLPGLVVAPDLPVPSGGLRVRAHPDAVRAALRQDPDALVVDGPVDEPLAELLAGAFLTGHLVIVAGDADAERVVARLAALGVSVSALRASGP